MEMKHNESRRSFLKKAAYTAPAVIALGTLTAPISAQASIVHMQGNGIIPGAKITADYDNVADRYSNVTRTGRIATTTFNDRVVNTSPFRLWLKSIFGA